MPRSQLEKDIRAHLRGLSPEERKPDLMKPVVDAVKAVGSTEVPKQDGHYLAVPDRDPADTDIEARRKAIVVRLSNGAATWGVGPSAGGRRAHLIDLWVHSIPLESNKLTKAIWDWERSGIEVEESK